MILVINNQVFAQDYDLGTNCKKVSISNAEKELYIKFVNDFLVRVKNKQFNYIANNMLFIPKLTHRGRPLTSEEINEIKQRFIKGLEEDYKYWKTAQLAEIAKFEVTEPDYRNKSTKKSHTIGIFIKTDKINIIEKTIYNNQKLRFAPLQLSVTKGKKMLVSGYHVQIDGIKTVPEYPDSVWPQGMD